MNSIWEKETVLPQYESLKQDLTVDVAVIGGGMAGILTAYLLQKQGVNVVVLEAKTIGSGQTGKTTAKITLQHHLISVSYTHLFLSCIVIFITALEQILKGIFFNIQSFDC